MSWWKTEQRPIVEWPEGRDWRCTSRSEATDGAAHVVIECGYVRPEAEGKDPGMPGYGCPECGGQLSRIVVQL